MFVIENMIRTQSNELLLSFYKKDLSPIGGLRQRNNFLYFHDGHCASGWMGDNRLVSTVEECAIICREREGCGYFAYDESRTFSTNCATYNESDGCVDDNRFPEYTAYEMV